MSTTAWLTLTENADGQWVPSIPLPTLLPFGRTRCHCGRRFRNRETYQGHYALAHVLRMEVAR